MRPRSAGSIPTEADRVLCAGRVDAWAADLAGTGPPVLAAGRDSTVNRWFVRLKGAEKDTVTIWLELRQRTLRHEAQMMPAPQTDLAGTFAYLLRRNAANGQLRLALGVEDAVFVVGEVAIDEVDADRLDQVVGGSLALIEDCFPTAMALGHADWYRRRPRVSVGGVRRSGPGGGTESD